VEGEQLATEVVGEAADAMDADATYFAAVLKPGASLERAEAALLDEIDKVTRAPLPAEELTKARNQLETAFVMGQDTTQERASVLGEAASLTGLTYLDHYLPRLAAVTSDQAQRVAALYFREANRTVTTETRRHGGTRRRRVGEP
jgi:zinc protease